MSDSKAVRKLKNQIEFREKTIKQYQAELPKLRTELAKLQKQQEKKK